MAYIRNPAFRMCAEELKNTTVRIEKEQGADKYASQFFLTPTGATVSRVAMFGVIVDKEDVSTGDQPFWRARMTDSTGGLFLYAGNYQPECSQIIARATVPSYVLVIGKPSIYTPEAGKGFIVSVRPDTIVFITEAARIRGDKEVLEFTKARVKLLESDVNLKKLVTEKYPDHASINKAMIDAMEKACEPQAQSSSFS